MLTRRRNQLNRVLNEAALALIEEARTRAPEDAGPLAELATRIDEMRVGLTAKPAGSLDVNYTVLRTAA